MNKLLQLWFAILLALAPAAWAEEFDSGGVKIHYQVEGKGEPVILIHGLMANAMLNWELPGVIAELAKHHQVIALDCRGHGMSGKPVSEDEYGVKMVDDVVRLMDHLNIQRADVVGYSMGGAITMKLMVLHSERVRSAVLGGMGWMNSDNVFPGDGKEKKSPTALDACVRGFKRLAVSAEDVRGIKTPFLVIIGDSDPLRQKYVGPLQKLRPDVPVKIVEGAGHVTCLAKPEFKKEIRAFLDGIRSPSASSMRIYRLPQGEVPAPISITAGGLPLPVSLCYVSACPYNRRWPGHQRTTDQREIAYFARLAGEGPITFRYTPGRAFSVCTVRPLSAKVTPTVKDGTITFTLPRAGGYSVELDGLHNALHLFLDPPMNYRVSPDARGVRYFGPGVHRIGILHLKDDETVYIDEGAVVYGCIHGDGVQRVRILGRGILDNSENVEEILRKVDKLGDGSVDVGNSRREHTIHLINSSDIEIEGITIRDSLLYNIACFGCSNLTVKNCKTIGCWRYNSDGIDLHNCRNARVADCFVRSYDDSLCAKGHPGYRYDTCEDILFENCVVWNDWGKALEIGAETSAEHLRRITFRNCDIIHATHPAIDIMNVDYGRVHDVLFDDIRIEYDTVTQRPAMQKNDETPFVVDPHSTYMPLAVCFNIQKHPEYSGGLDRRGYVYDITLRNIRIYADRMPSSSLYGYDEEHAVSDITVDGFFLGDRRITSLEEARFHLGKHTRNVQIR